MSHSYRGFDWKVLELAPIGSYVEVGAGLGSWGYELKIRGIATEITAIEPHKPYCDMLRRFNVYDEVINKNIFEIPKHSIKRRVAICSDVIEHNDRDKADLFLEILESLARVIIVTTPNGDMLNDNLEHDGNMLNRHKSHYNRRFFEDRGYLVSVIRYYPDAPRIFRPFIRAYNKIRGLRGIDSQIIAVKYLESS